MALSKADRIWNRAALQFETPLPPEARRGDRALAAALVADSQIRCDGVLQALGEVLTEPELQAALDGYRYFGLQAAADLLDEARVTVVRGLAVDEAERLEPVLDAAYEEAAAGFVQAFERRLAASPDEFAPG
jgi:hypothetical protein